MSDRQIAAMRAQMEEMKARQAEAMAMLQSAQQEIAAKQGEVEKARRELQEAEANKQRVGAEADHALKSASGDKEAKILAEGLERDGFAYIDNFMGETLVEAVFDEVKHMHDSGLMCESELAGGKSGNNLRYSAADVRGDVVCFVEGTEEACQTIRLLKELSDQVVAKLQDYVGELKGETLQRGRLMCTCYPGGPNGGQGCGGGGPCGYVQHCDNPNRNGRRLTTLYYLNKDWEASHGGHLRITPSDQASGRPLSSTPPVDIAPLADRFLIFWSDLRNPHQVMPAYVSRYAITTWYYSAAEKAAVGSMAEAEVEVEAARIRAEIAKNAGKNASAEAKATAFIGATPDRYASTPDRNGGLDSGTQKNPSQTAAVDLEELD